MYLWINIFYGIVTKLLLFFYKGSFFNTEPSILCHYGFGWKYILLNNCKQLIYNILLYKIQLSILKNKALLRLTVIVYFSSWKRHGAFLGNFKKLNKEMAMEKHEVMKAWWIFFYHKILTLHQNHQCIHCWLHMNCGDIF